MLLSDGYKNSEGKMKVGKRFQEYLLGFGTPVGSYGLRDSELVFGAQTARGCILPLLSLGGGDTA